MIVLWIGLGICALFLGIAFLLNKDNAGSLLNGYRNLSPEDQANYPLSEMLALFKGFHIFLAIATALGLITFYLLKMPTEMTLFLAIFPMLAYFYLGFRQRQLLSHMPSQTKMLNLAMGVLVITAIGVGYLFYSGSQTSDLLVSKEGIQVTGMYDYELSFDEIASITIVSELPNMKRKVNGYAVGDTKKGHFTTSSGERVHLVINRKASEYLEIVDQEGKRYYFGDPGIDLKQKLAGSGL